jgi:hypothetical protein
MHFVPVAKVHTYEFNRPTVVVAPINKVLESFRSSEFAVFFFVATSVPVFCVERGSSIGPSISLFTIGISGWLKRPNHVAVSLV